jgi:PAS domain S-box-containing protein
MPGRVRRLPSLNWLTGRGRWWVPVAVWGAGGAALAVGLLLLPPNTGGAVPQLAVLAWGGMAIGLTGLASGGRWRVLVVPVALVLDGIAVYAAASTPIGNEGAVILPLLGAILLVAVLEGWPLRLGLMVGWLAGVAGVAIARSGPAFLEIPGSAPPMLAAASMATVTGAGYLGLAWLAASWRQALADANAAAAASERAAETIRAIVEHSPMPTLAFDRDQNIQTWNPAAERLLGWTEEEVLDRSMLVIVPEAMQPMARELIARALAGGAMSESFRTTLVRKDGSEVPIEAYGALKLNADGSIVGVVVQLLDVAIRQALEARLVESQRLEAVGLLAGGVAHDFNNSLTAITGFASLIASGGSPDPREDARTILAASEHAATLTRQLLTFSRRVPLEPEILDLNQILVEVEPLVRRLTGETIQIRLEPDDRPALANLDPSTLEQAILNLASNARDAMPLGGEVTLSVRRYPACVGGEGREAESHLAVAVSDTGEGIPAPAMHRLFEPFFTTKPPGKGTGLGLPMVHGFAAQSGGHVVVSSPPGQGATVEIHFPEASGVVAADHARPAPVGGSEAILFVEDDPDVASFGLACLRRLGYDVTPAMNGTEAMALTASRAKPFDLLLTDVIIPGMSGPELAELVRSHHPETAILYSSGYGAEQVSVAIVGHGARLLEKPYSLEQLATRVREALDRRPNGKDRPKRVSRRA